MAIRANDTLEFATCPTLIEPPITGADCTNFPSFEELVEAEEVADSGCTIRSGMAFAVRAIVDIETDCEAV